MEIWRSALIRPFLPVQFAAEGEGGGGERSAGDDPGGSYPEGDEKLFSQTEVETLVAQKTAAYAGVDMQEYKSLKEARAKQEREALEKKGDFDKILAQTVKEKDDVIGQREQEITSLGEQLTKIRVDNTLLAAASAAKAINPQQIVTLLKGNVHYDRNADTVEVRENGSPLYKSGRPVSVAQYVQEFLGANPHFLPSGPAGSGAAGGTSMSGGAASFKISAAEAKDPAKYRAARDAAEKAGQALVIERL